MTDPCVARVAARARISEAQARRAVEAVRSFRDENITTTASDMLGPKIKNLAADEGEAAIRQALEKRRRALISAEKFSEMDAAVKAQTQLTGKSWQAALADRVWRIDHEGKGLFVKMAARLNQMMRRDKGLAARFQRDAKFNEEVVRERHEPGTSQDPQVREIAALMNETEEQIRLAFNDAGLNIGKLEGYGGAHKYDSGRISRDPAGFAQMLNETLDWEKSFPGFDKLRPEIQAVFQADTAAAVRSHILKGEEISLDPAKYQKRRGRRAATRLEEHRTLHYKDAESWVRMNRDFGEGGVLGGFRDRLEYASSRLALMRALGPNPEGTLARLIDLEKNRLRQISAGTDPQTLKALDKLGRNNLADGSGAIGRAFRMVSGGDRSPVNLTMARIGSGLRSWENMAKLGSALLSQLSDIPTMAMQAKVKFGYSLFEAWGEALGGFFGGIPPEVREEFAGLIDVFSDSVRGRLSSRLGGYRNEPGLMTRMSETFMKWNGMSLWTDNARAGGVAMISNALGRVADKSLAELGPEMAYLLRSHGLDKHWDLIRQYGFYKFQDRAYIVPERLKKIPDQVIDGLIQDKILKTMTEAAARGADPEPMIAGLRRKERNKLDLDLHTFFAAEVDNFIVTPDARSRASLTFGTKPGTVLGEAARTYAQLKSFSVAYFQKVFWPMVVGRPGRELPGRLGDLALLIAQTTAFGYLSLNAKRLVKGEKPTWTDDDNNAWSVGASSFLQGGGAGLYGDFFLAERSRFGHSPLEDLAGPVGGAAADVMQLWGRFLNPEENVGAADFLNFGINNTPFVNLWYTRAALDYAVLYSAREALSPGWLRRREQNMRRNGGREYIFPPTQYRARPFG